MTKFLFAILVSVGTAQAFAQAWPARTLRMVVAFPPGGPTDVAARVVSQKVAERLGQPVIVDNRPGAAGNIGMEAVARAAPDGYTFLYGNTALVTNPFTYKVSWDPLSDFAPVSQVASATFVLLVNPGFAPRKSSSTVSLAFRRQWRAPISRWRTPMAAPFSSSDRTQTASEARASTTKSARRCRKLCAVASRPSKTIAWISYGATSGRSFCGR